VAEKKLISLTKVCLYKTVLHWSPCSHGECRHLCLSALIGFLTFLYHFKLDIELYLHLCKTDDVMAFCPLHGTDCCSIISSVMTCCRLHSTDFYNIMAYCRLHGTDCYSVTYIPITYSVFILQYILSYGSQGGPLTVRLRLHSTSLVGFELAYCKNKATH
jgi:hypothetical protein